MVPKFAPDWFPNCVPDGVGGSGGGWVAGGDCAQLAPFATINQNASTNRRTIVRLVWPQEAVELRSAWTPRLRSRQAPEAAIHAQPFRNSGGATMQSIGFDEARNGTRCSQNKV